MKQNLHKAGEVVEVCLCMLSSPTRLNIENCSIASILDCVAIMKRSAVSQR